MFTKVSPESVGISSEKVLKYLKVLNRYELSCHSVLIARGDKLFCEAYWAPFDKTVAHRMYSQTKSYVGLAVHLLAEDGMIKLDDPIINYFSDKLPDTIHPYLQKQTIRHMLMMRTCFEDYDVDWFTSGTDDRVKLYFSQRPAVYPGTQYRYDSMGSFVLGALVERLTGKLFLDYLREKCLDEIGFSKDAYVLKCPGGHSWADSALICTPEDMLKYGRFIGRRGEWNGKQIIPRHILEEAFTEVSDTFVSGFRAGSNYGYSNQFWFIYGRGVGFNGMHGQYTVYDAETDITFTCTSGNFRSDVTKEILISHLFSNIIEEAEDKLDENEKAYSQLTDYISSLKLITIGGAASSVIEKEISGKIFRCEENKPGIEWYSLTFKEKECEFRYKNKFGEKLLVFGRHENVFQQFPQKGYSDIYGGMDGGDRTYKCAASFGWGTENQLIMKAQIIDTYIGNVLINFSYADSFGRMKLTGDAENFLREYNGRINAFMID